MADLNPSLGLQKQEQDALDFSIPQPLVTIIVDIGANEKTFQIYRNLISYHSPFFAAAFKNTKFIEGQTQSMTLEDVSASTFGLFVHWLCTQNMKGKTTGDYDLVEQAKFYLLSRRFLVADLDTTLLQEMKATFSPETINKPTSESLATFYEYVYGDEVEKDSTLRDLAVLHAKYCAFDLKEDEVDGFARGLPAAMMLDFMIAYMKDSTGTSNQPPARFAQNGGAPKRFGDQNINPVFPPWMVQYGDAKRQRLRDGRSGM